MADPNNTKGILTIVLVILIGVIAYAALTAPDNRSTGERVGDAIDELGDRTPGEKLGDAVEDAGEDIKRNTGN